MNTVPMVSHRITFDWFSPQGRTLPVTVTVSWWADVPFEVEFLFHSRGRPRWVLSRDFLAEGAFFAVGEGDVRLRPDEDPEWLRLTLSSPPGRAEFLVPTHALGAFLADTFTIVPAGTEVLPDAWFQEITS